MSDSEFHSCKCGEAGGGMEPGARARGAMDLPAAAAQLMYYHSCNDKT